MAAYMQSLKIKVGYVSLKIKYFETQAKNFPSLPGSTQQEESGYSNMEEADTNEEILPINPIEEKDKKIAELEKLLAEQSIASSDMNQLQEKLTKTKAELQAVKKNSTVLNKKINFAKKVT